MAKTELTKSLERSIWIATKKHGVFGCFEVTIGWSGDQRVDYMTYDTKGVFRCFEIKASKKDFHSKCALTFVGNYNYFVLPASLYEEVQDEIPAGIGAYVFADNQPSYWNARGGIKKRAARRTLTVDKDVLRDSLLRSLAREADKEIKRQMRGRYAI